LVAGVIRTVEAVTAPVVEAGPTALTQTPTAKAVAAAFCVSVRVVDLAVVIFSFSVFGSVGFFDLEDLEDLEELFELLFAAEKSPLTRMPDNVTVPLLTPVTFPVAMARLARPGKPRPEELGRPPVPPLAKLSPPLLLEEPPLPPPPKWEPLVPPPPGKPLPPAKR
jgi:hypothetical protein